MAKRRLPSPGDQVSLILSATNHPFYPTFRSIISFYVDHPSDRYTQQLLSLTYDEAKLWLQPTLPPPGA